MLLTSNKQVLSDTRNADEEVKGNPKTKDSGKVNKPVFVN